MANPVSIRHWLAGSALTISVLMVIGGVTVFSSSLKDAKFIIYWLVCAGFTGLAGLIAALEILLIRRQARNLEKKLIKEFLDDENNP